MKPQHVINFIVLSYFVLFNNAIAVQTCQAEVIASTPTSDFINNANGTATHSKTGLTWKVCSEGQTWSNGACTGTTTTHTWQAALQIPQTLNSSGGYANQTDWRLPNIKELNSIVENQCYSPSINASIFASTASSGYWSSSPSANDSNSAWIVYFYNGGGVNDYRSNGVQVRLVRSYSVPTTETISMNFIANVAYVDDINGVLEGAVNVGDTLTGDFKYNLLTVDTNSFSTVGDYKHTETPYGIRVNAADGFIFKTDPSNVEFLVEVINDHGSNVTDGFLLRSYNNANLINGVYVEHISWQLDDSTATAITSVSLPLEPLKLSSWQSDYGLTMTGCINSDQASDNICGYDEQFFIRAHITYIVNSSEK